MASAGFGWRRAGAHRLVLVAVFATVLMTSTLLSLTGLYAGAVTQSGLRVALAGAPLPDRALEIGVPVDGRAAYDREAAATTAALDSAFDVVGVTVHASATSGSYGFRGTADAAAGDLLVFGFYEDLSDHAALVRGSWPGTSSAGPVQVALPTPAARRLGLEPGESADLVNRLSGQRVRVLVTGVFSAQRTGEAFWLGDDLVDGVQAGSSFMTHGPLVVPRSTFLARFPADATAVWRAEPDFTAVTTDDLAVLESSVPALTGTAGSGALGEDALVETGLPDLVRSLAQPLLVLRTTTALPVALLALLAICALGLSIRLLTDHRAVETELLRARGMSNGQLAMSALGEAIVITVPAGLVAPPVAAALLRVCDGRGPFADDGVAASVPLSATAWWISAAVAAGACGLLLAASWTRGSDLSVGRQTRGRPRRTSSVQRAGGDVVLAALAGLAYWQLRRYGSPVVADASGRAAVDPLLVAAPAMLLLAAAVLLVRLVPLLSRGLEVVARRTRGAAPALGVWQLSRRAPGHSGPATLLALATAVGMFALVFAETWAVSRQDQADFDTGADLRLTSAPAALAADDLTRLPGAVAVTPVWRDEAAIGGADAVVLGVDPDTAGDVMVVRPDLTSQPLSQLTSGVAGPLGPVLAIPSEADSLVLPVRIAADGPAQAGRAVPGGVDVNVVVRDRVGRVHRLSAGTVAADDRHRRLVIDLDDLDAVGLVAVEAGTAGGDATLTLRLGPPHGRAAGDDLGPLTAPAGTRWQLVVERTAQSPASGRLVGSRGPDGPLRAHATTRCCDPQDFTLMVTGAGPAAGQRTAPDAAGTVPALVSSELADLLGSADTFVLDTEGVVVRLRVVGVLDAVPTIDPATAAGAVVDVGALSDAVYRQSRASLPVTEWWIRLDPAGSAATAAAAARDDPLLTGATVLSRTAALDAGGSGGDPVGAGVTGAMGVGVLAAGAFAAAGFALGAVISVRSRRGELAVLHAVGVGRRMAARLLMVEQAVVVALGVGAGLLAGLAVAELVVPAITLTPNATTPFPVVTVTTPLPSLALFAAAVVTVTAVVVALVVRGVGHRLRTSDRLAEDE